MALLPLEIPRAEDPPPVQLDVRLPRLVVIIIIIVIVVIVVMIFALVLTLTLTLVVIVIVIVVIVVVVVVIVVIVGPRDRPTGEVDGVRRRRRGGNGKPLHELLGPLLGPLELHRTEHGERGVRLREDRHGDVRSPPAPQLEMQRVLRLQVHHANHFPHPSAQLVAVDHLPTVQPDGPPTHASRASPGPVLHRQRVSLVCGQVEAKPLDMDGSPPLDRESLGPEHHHRVWSRRELAHRSRSRPQRPPAQPDRYG